MHESHTLKLFTPVLGAHSWPATAQLCITAGPRFWILFCSTGSAAVGTCRVTACIWAVPQSAASSRSRRSPCAAMCGRRPCGPWRACVGRQSSNAKPPAPRLWRRPKSRCAAPHCCAAPVLSGRPPVSHLALRRCVQSGHQSWMPLGLACPPSGSSCCSAAAPHQGTAVQGRAQLERQAILECKLTARGHAVHAPGCRPRTAGGGSCSPTFRTCATTSSS